MKSARQLAFEVLRKVIRDNSYSNLAVSGVLQQNHLSDEERSFFTALVYGTIERKITLDYELSLYLKQPLRKLNPKVYAILLLGSYQILFLDKVPSHAAVNESVKLTKKNGVSYASGLVNAVLHKIAANGLRLPSEQDHLHYLSVKYSCPEPLISLWIDSYGEDAALGILDYSLGAEPVVIRVNTVKTTLEELTLLLEERGISAHPHSLVGDSLVLENAPAIESLDLFQQGYFHVQDASSQLCCEVLAPRPGETVYDVCAAPGGKSFTMAERMNDRGEVYSYDLYDHRTRLIADGAERLGLHIIHAGQGDASVFHKERKLADRVLCDVPCSGLGIIGRKPEIRYKAAAEIDNLPALQYDILCISARYCRPGGRLVYSTCSLNPAENELVVSHFLKEHKGYRLIQSRTLLPGTDHCDGFFISLIERLEESH